jgi:hypothetical protein
MGATEEAAEAIETLLTVQQTDPEQALIDLFDATGVAYVAQGGTLHLE